MTQVVKVTFDGGSIKTEPMEFLTHATAKARRMSPTGAELAAEIDELMERRPDISRHRFGKCINGCSNGIGDVRKRLYPRAATVKKVRDLIANPPPECLKQKHPRAGTGTARRRGKIQDTHDLEMRRQRRYAAIRRAANATAKDRIERGLDANSARQATVKFAQQAMEERMRDEARLADPIEQALLALRRDRHIIYRASVKNGPHNHFIIRRRSGDQEIDEQQLLQMAKHA